MSLRRFTDLLKGRAGRMLLFATLFFSLFVLIARRHTRLARERDTVRASFERPPAAQWWSDARLPGDGTKPEFTITDRREGFQAFLPPLASPPADSVAVTPPPSPEPRANRGSPILWQGAAARVEAADPPEQPPAPSAVPRHGDLLHCRLLAPVRSDQREVPVRARLAESLVRGGHVVLPAGTILDGRLRSAGNGRLLFERKWTAELPSGLRMEIIGEALESAVDPLGGRRLASDGTPGIPARSEAAPDTDDGSWKRIAGTFAAAAARMAQDRTRSAIGDRIPPSGRNILLEGVADLIEEHADPFADPETDRGSRPPSEAPSGTGFYIEVVGLP